MNEQRLIDLETKFSYQEETIEDLRQTVHAQYLLIEKLEKNLKSLLARIDAEIDGGLDLSHKKPPHY